MNIEVEYNPVTRSYDFWITNDTPNGAYIAKPLRLEMEIINTAIYLPPTFTVNSKELDILMPKIHDAMNRIGFKPKEEAKIEGILEATKYHLEDMRKLVFKVSGK